MSDKPPPIPLKYKVKEPEPALGTGRPIPPPPAKPRLSHRAAWFRVLIGLVILVSVAVAYWSFYDRLQPLQKESRSIISKVAAMSGRLDQSERRWTAEQAKEIRTRYREAYKQLFSDPTALEDWLGQVEAQARPLGLDVKIGLGAGTPQGGMTNSLAAIPASISLEVLPVQGEASGKSPYERVLTFSRRLAAYGKRADLAEFSVTGGAGSVSRAVLVFNLWVGEFEGEAGTTQAAK